jgi:hypothetical protein
VLPGTLPGGSAQRRPLVQGLEDAGAAAARAAVELWQRLEGRLEPGLIAQIHLNAPLEEAVPGAPAPARGLVLVSRQGTRLVWGRPEEERFGAAADARAEALLHTIRCQGDLGPVAAINVRFRQPFYTLRTP